MAKRTFMRRLDLHRINAMLMLLVMAVLCATCVFTMAEGLYVQLLNATWNTARNVAALYAQNCDQHWSIYVPITSNPEFQNVIDTFLAGSAEPNSLLKREMTAVLKNVASTKTDIAALLLYRKKADDLYLYSIEANTLLKMPDSSPYLSLLREKDTTRLHIGTRFIHVSENQRVPAYGVATNYLNHTTDMGSFCVLYRADALLSTAEQQELSTMPHILLTTGNGDVILDSLGQYDGRPFFLPGEDTARQTLSMDGESYILQRITGPRNQYILYSLTPAAAIRRLAHRYTPLILAVSGGFALISITLHLRAGSVTKKNVLRIKYGLSQIGGANPNFRFGVREICNEYDTIQRDIDRMADCIREGIRKNLEFSMKRKLAEMREIQSKFNPHFLYNAIDAIRANIERNGDSESAEMLVLLSAIFRSLLSSALFVTIQEEISFIELYLSLYRMRFGDAFRVQYNIDSQLMHCGILRNLMQPVVENYFVHGFDSRRADNRLWIAVKAENGGLHIDIANNGHPIPQERLNALRELLSHAEREQQPAGKYYGLAGIHRQIRLFYGPQYGICVQDAPQGAAVCVSLRIARMSVEEHEVAFQEMHPGLSPEKRA